jgi:two-component system, OmpR family, response regulator MprA
MQPPRPTALVADDSVAVRRLVAAQLRHDGYDVREAGDGHEALEQLGGAAPDLLVVDDVLPGLSGAELVQLLRSRGGHSQIAFLVEYDAGLRRAELAGVPAGAVIRKPFDLTALSQAVRAISAG